MHSLILTDPNICALQGSEEARAGNLTDMKLPGLPADEGGRTQAPHILMCSPLGFLQSWISSTAVGGPPAFFMLSSGDLAAIAWNQARLQQIQHVLQ